MTGALCWLLWFFCLLENKVPTYITILAFVAMLNSCTGI